MSHTFECSNRRASTLTLKAYSSADMARLLDAPPPPQDYSDSLSDSEEYDSDEPTSALGYSELSTVNQDADWEQQVDIDSVR